MGQHLSSPTNHADIAPPCLEIPLADSGFHDHRRLYPPDRHRRLGRRSEEHTSELQSQSNLVCRLLLEKKNKKYTDHFQLFMHAHYYSGELVLHALFDILDVATVVRRDLNEDLVSDVDALVVQSIAVLV